MTTTYKTLTLGSKKPDLKGVEVSSYAKQLLAKTTYQEEKESIDLVVLTPADLGFTTYPTTAELFARAKEQGYGLCPAEVGPRLAGTLEEAGWLYVAMEPITDSDGYPRVFLVGRYGDGGQWLGTDWTGPGSRWDLSYRIVFTLNKESSKDSGNKKVRNRTRECWYAMKNRCNNYNHARYKDYGGRGISYSEEWEDYEVFLADMGEMPSGRSLDRIDNNGNYCKENCRWATPKEQGQNRSDTVLFNGETAKDASVRLGGGYGLVTQRINDLGWSLEEAFTTPANGLRKSLGTHGTPTSETALGDLESLSLRVEKLEKTIEALKKALV